MATLCQPLVGVKITVTELAAANTAPAFSAVAETTINPEGGMVIFKGNTHLLLFLSARQSCNGYINCRVGG